MALTVVFETGSIFFDGGDDGDSCVCLAERSSSEHPTETRLLVARSYCWKYWLKSPLFPYLCVCVCL